MIRKIMIVQLVFLVLLSCGDRERGDTKAPKSRELKQKSKIIVEDVSLNERIERGSLENKTTEQLRIIRNGIFAKHGLKFRDERLTQYFEKFNWYEQENDNVEHMLTDMDRRNLKLIQRFEQDRGGQSMVAQKLNVDSNERIADFELPMTLREFVNVLGEPDMMKLGGDEYSSIGQFHYWLFENLNVKIVALCDKYNKEVDYNSDVRYFSIHKINPQKESSYKGFSGITPGEKLENVNEKLKEYVSRNKTFATYQTSQGAMLYNFVGEKNIKDLKQIVLTNNKQYIYFVFDEKNELLFIAQSNFNIITAG